MPHIGNSNGENDDCPSNLGVPYLPHKATFMHLSCVFFDSTSRLVWVMNHFAPKSHLQPSNNSWSWKFLQLKLGFQMFPVDIFGNLSRVRSPATHHCCLVQKAPEVTCPSTMSYLGWPGCSAHPFLLSVGRVKFTGWWWSITKSLQNGCSAHSIVYFCYCLFSFTKNIIRFLSFQFHHMSSLSYQPPMVFFNHQVIHL